MNEKETINFAYSVIDKCIYAVLSTISPDNTPYGVPINIARIGDNLYFHSAKEGQKVINLINNPVVCVTCVGDVRINQDKHITSYESAIVFGKAEVVEQEHEVFNALKALCLKYTPDNMIRFDIEYNERHAKYYVFKIRIDKISAKKIKYDNKTNELKI